MEFPGTVGDEVPELRKVGSRKTVPLGCRGEPQGSQGGLPLDCMLQAWKKSVVDIGPWFWLGRNPSFPAG